VLAAELDPCTVHTLWLSYPLNLPSAPLSGGLEWLANDTLYYDTWLSDLYAGRYLESWLPANMPWDTYPLSLGLTLTDAGAPHTLISNAAVDEMGEHDWQLEFPSTMRAMSPLVIVVPSEDVIFVSGTHPSNGQDIPYTLYRHDTVGTGIATLEATLLGSFDQFTLGTGEFLHPSFTGFIGANARSMEYDGAFTTKVPDISHEAFHSWWARGVHPATYADGWIDEAWDMYNTTQGQSFTVEPFNWNDPTAVLYDAHPFARITPLNSYDHGRRVFAGLAALMGVDGLRMAMAELYAAIGLEGALTTAALERHLYCVGGEDPQIRQAFWRFVYGQGGNAPAPDMNYCG
ncbi:MAG: hypothetical protein KC431_06290, partial [Myxococcales bacterium]|nr:hypothetical protein [Myxococcales bacterium]